MTNVSKGKRGEYETTFLEYIHESSTSFDGDVEILEVDVLKFLIFALFLRFQVTWSYRSNDVFRLLTVGRNAYSVDARISLHFK